MTADKRIGWSKFALERHIEGSGFSFYKSDSIGMQDYVPITVWNNWPRRQPGQGETGLDRKIVVPVDPFGFYSGYTTLRDDLPVRAEVVRRQPHEDPFVDIYVDADEAAAMGILPEPAKFCNIVLYSAEALLENGGERSTDADWEIVAILASHLEKEVMPPLTMARNFLEKVGGTKSVYSAQEFAEAIYYWSTRGIKIKRK